MRVVMRTSPVENFVSNGWCVLSWRPREKSYPNRSITFRPKASCCCSGKCFLRQESSAGSCDVIARTSGTSASRSSAKTFRTSAVFIP